MKKNEKVISGTAGAAAAAGATPIKNTQSDNPAPVSDSGGTPNTPPVQTPNEPNGAYYGGGGTAKPPKSSGTQDGNPGTANGRTPTEPIYGGGGTGYPNSGNNNTQPIGNGDAGTANTGNGASGSGVPNPAATLNQELWNQSQQGQQEQIVQETLLQNEIQNAQANPNAKQVSYIDPNGQTQTGYIINGVTYTDTSGTQEVPVGSTVTDSYGRQWYKGDNGSVPIGSGNGAATPVTYIDADGVQHTGYMIGNVTYTDPTGTTAIPTGSTVTTPDGKHWYKGEDGGYQISEIEFQRNLQDLSPLINQQFDAADEAAKLAINYGTQGAVDQLNRALQDAQPSYEAAIANQLLETKQAQDAQALRNQVNGDRGGIGSAQVDSIVNAGARNREAIATQQRQLATDTARQIADLRAQGKYQEAAALLQNAQQRLSALYNEGVRLQQVYDTKMTQLASLGSTYMNAGIMPTDDMLAALGIDKATAQLHLNRLGYGDGSGGGKSGGGGGGYTGYIPPTTVDDFEYGDGMNGNEFRWLQMTLDEANRQNDQAAMDSAMDYADGRISKSQYDYLAKVYGWDNP